MPRDRQGRIGYRYAWGVTQPSVRAGGERGQGAADLHGFSFFPTARECRSHGREMEQGGVR